MDPEELEHSSVPITRCCAELVERNGGFVAKYMGDGGLAYVEPLVYGEAGIGKSRLAAAFLERVATEPHMRLRGQGSAANLRGP